MKKYICEEKSALIEQVAKLSPDSSRTTIRSLLKEMRVTLNGRVVKEAAREVIPGDEVRLWPKVKKVQKDVEILYEDPYLVVINKPAGLLSVEANYEDVNTAHSVLKDLYRPGRVFVIHRLDREASGVMMFARDDATLWNIKEQLQKHEVQRNYSAIVEGAIKEEKGVWQSYLVQDENYVMHSLPESHVGEFAVTHYEVAKRSAKFTQLEITLETGRKNQIRVQSAYNGHPIVGDKKYGAKRNPVERLCLHAYKLSFIHPAKEKRMCFEVHLPDEFYTIWET
ncbi:MAG: RluA family pseudouridine synthase [Chlamydiales bacterium]|nr:RluA family pseudouridine synthase [Chlamydiales bacterium]